LFFSNILDPARVNLDAAFQFDLAGHFARNMRVMSAFTAYNSADQRRQYFQLFASLRHQLSKCLFYATISPVVSIQGLLLAV
jgi:hypothetical protein